jgi:hypothetical protein
VAIPSSPKKKCFHFLAILNEKSPLCIGSQGIFKIKIWEKKTPIGRLT